MQGQQEGSSPYNMSSSPGLAPAGLDESCPSPAAGTGWRGGKGSCTAQQGQ